MVYLHINEEKLLKDFIKQEWRAGVLRETKITSSWAAPFKWCSEWSNRFSIF